MKNINRYLKCGVILGTFIYLTGTNNIINNNVFADEINSELVNNETTKQWKPEGNVIAQSEEGVPWELYENGYLLFKPESGNDEIYPHNKEEINNNFFKDIREKIKAIGFKSKTYLGSYFYGGLTFAGLENLEYFDGDNLYISKNENDEANFYGMFLDDKNLKYVDLNNIDMSKVKSLKAMFAGAGSLEYLDVTNWDVSNVNNFEGFIDGTNIKKLDLSKWKFKEGSKRKNFFKKYSSLKILEEISLPESFFLNEDEIKKYIVDGEVPNIYDFFGLGINEYEAYRAGKVGNSNWIRKEDKKEIRDFSKLKINDKSNAGTWTRRYSKIHFIGDDNIKPPADIIEFSNKFTDESLLLPEPTNKVVRDEETGDYYIFKTWTEKGREIEGVEKGWPLKDLPVKTISDVKELYKTLFKTIDTIKGDEYLTYIVSPRYEKIENVKREQLPIKPRVLYKGDETLDRGTNEETDGISGKKEVITIYKINPSTGELTEPTTTESIITAMAPKIIKVGIKPKIEIIKNNGKTIERMTKYLVDENTGKITDKVIDKIISSNTPLIPNPNGNDLPDEPELNTNEKPEYTGPLSTNTPIDENGNLILPPTIEKPEFNGGVNSIEPPVTEKSEYTGPLSINTPIDEDLILPSVINELPNNKKPTLEVPDLIKPEKENRDELKEEKINNNNNNKRELPNTNSSSVIASLVSSIISTLSLGYKTKRK